MSLRTYSPCDTCGAECESDITFYRRLDDGWLQYSLCNKHLPKLNPRVWIWTHQWRVGRTIATFLGLGIGLSGCYKCGTPWDCIRSHTTYYTRGTGCLPLCEKCWQELTPEQRLPYYEKLVASWERYSIVEQDTKDQIRVAVLRGA